MCEKAGTERERLIAWMAERGLSHEELARRLKWSPSYVFGALGGAWGLSDSFRWTFARVFGFEAAGEVFDVEEQVGRVLRHSSVEMTQRYVADVSDGSDGSDVAVEVAG